MTQRGVGFSEAEGSRVAVFRRLYEQATEFVEVNALGFIRLGVTQTYKASDGLAYTGQDAQKDRLDPDDSALSQPAFHKRQFGHDDPYGAGEED